MDYKAMKKWLFNLITGVILIFGCFALIGCHNKGTQKSIYCDAEQEIPNYDVNDFMNALGKERWNNLTASEQSESKNHLKRDSAKDAIIEFYKHPHKAYNAMSKEDKKQFKEFYRNRQNRQKIQEYQKDFRWIKDANNLTLSDKILIYAADSVAGLGMR